MFCVQVCKSFRAMQRGAGMLTPTNEVLPTSLNDVPESAWPLFLTSFEWLVLLDRSTSNPFLSPEEASQEFAWDEIGGLDFLPSLDDDDDDDPLQSDEAAADFDGGAPATARRLQVCCHLFCSFHVWMCTAAWWSVHRTDRRK